MEFRKKTMAILLITILMLSAMSFVIPVMANTVESSTMHFEGVLSGDPETGYTTVTTLEGAPETVTGIAMTIGEYYTFGNYPAGHTGPYAGDPEKQGGFDVYAKEGATAYVKDYVPDTYVIGSDHDAYSKEGPWGDWWDPDCGDWDQYSLELTEDHWYLRYTVTGESPMSGTLTWFGDGTGYASETDKGTYDPEDDGVGPYPVYEEGSQQMWDWDAGAQVERIPLEYLGFKVVVTLDSGVYHVTLTPAPIGLEDVQGTGLIANSETVVTLTLSDDGNGYIGDIDGYELDAVNIYTIPPFVPVLLYPCPDTNYVLDHWELDGSDVGSDPVYTVMMDEDHDHDVKAFFKFVPVVSITVSPADIHFSDVELGFEHSPDLAAILKISNGGNVPVTVTAEIPNTMEPGDLFFRKYFELDQTLTPWAFGTIDPLGFIEKIPTLDLVSAHELGSFTSSIIFWAEG